eukprot:TRINITY_DN5855_c0_g2_i2.p1 TRINITY_DN5855_c0_g2~~TRINITY_DN5855_c0_g2_i2.p1  ORF type:complete len:441 (+),score=147.25 TRINITY_DN5855_c0_g2_i2:724-2046(+)
MFPTSVFFETSSGASVSSASAGQLSSSSHLANVNFFCSRAPMQVCRLMYEAASLPDACEATLDLKYITIHRPVILLLNVVGIIVSTVLCWGAFSDWKSTRGRAEYLVMFFLFAVTSVLSLITHCLFPGDDVAAQLWAFASVVSGVLLCVSVAFAGLADNNIIFLRRRPFSRIPLNFNRLIAIGVAAVALSLLVSAMASGLYEMLMVVWLLAIFTTLVVYPVSQVVFFVRLRAFLSLIWFLAVSVVFLAGFALWIFLGNYLCTHICKYTGGEEAFWLATDITIWLLYQYYWQKNKDYEKRHGVIKMTDADGKIHLVIVRRGKKTSQKLKHLPKTKMRDPSNIRHTVYLLEGKDKEEMEKQWEKEDDKNKKRKLKEEEKVLKRELKVEKMKSAEKNKKEMRTADIELDMEGVEYTREEGQDKCKEGKDEPKRDSNLTPGTAV